MCPVFVWGECESCVECGVLCVVYVCGCECTHVSVQSSVKG